MTLSMVHSNVAKISMMMTTRIQGVCVNERVCGDVNVWMCVSKCDLSGGKFT